MNNQTQEALKMAIRIMKAFDNEIPTNSTKEAINACKEVLEQPAQEPVAWINEDELPDEYPYDEMFKHSEIVYGVRVFPVYPPKHHWQGLTDDEILKASSYIDMLGNINDDDVIEFARAIEQALKEKNT